MSVPVGLGSSSDVELDRFGVINMDEQRNHPASLCACLGFEVDMCDEFAQDGFRHRRAGHAADLEPDAARSSASRWRCLYRQGQGVVLAKNSRVDTARLPFNAP